MSALKMHFGEARTAPAFSNLRERRRVSDVRALRCGSRRVRVRRDFVPPVSAFEGKQNNNENRRAKTFAFAATLFDAICSDVFFLMGSFREIRKMSPFILLRSCTAGTLDCSC